MKFIFMNSPFDLKEGLLVSFTVDERVSVLEAIVAPNLLTSNFLDISLGIIPASSNTPRAKALVKHNNFELPSYIIEVKIDEVM
jgi:hypothetical protein